MTIETPSDLTAFDPVLGESGNEIFDGYMDQLFMTDWTTDPSAQNYQLSFWPNAQAAGELVQSWDFTTPGTLLLTLRQGVYWQNIAPSNGRELTAADVVYHFDRMMGLGDGFTTPAPYWGTVANWLNLKSVTATGNFSVTMQWSTNNEEFIEEIMEFPDAAVTIEDPDAVAAFGNLNNWHNAIGTGPDIRQHFRGRLKRRSDIP